MKGATCSTVPDDVSTGVSVTSEARSETRTVERVGAFTLFAVADLQITIAVLLFAGAVTATLSPAERAILVWART